jgi:hypothetical protein
MYNSTTQTTTTGQWTAVSFNTAVWTNGFALTTPSTRMTAPISGLYRVTATVQIPGNSGGTNRSLCFRVNGNSNNRYGLIGGPLFSSGTSTTFTITTILSLSTSDYVEVYVFQDSGATLTLPGEVTYNGIQRFTIEYL